MKNFTVIKSTPGKTGNFVTKLYSETAVETPFGTKMKRETYYVSGTKQLVPDTVVPLELSAWDIKEYPYAFMDDNTGIETTVNCKWLHCK